MIDVSFTLRSVHQVRSFRTKRSDVESHAMTQLERTRRRSRAARRALASVACAFSKRACPSAAPPRARRARFALATVICVTLALACAGSPREAPAGWPPDDAVRLSLLALGDTGRPVPRFRPHAQRIVGEALAREDARRPADALLLLGDNFYYDGLQRAELVRRMGENVVRPYCRFVDLSGPRSEEVEASCPLPAAQRRPIPMLAVLGNHDYGDPESPGLQRREAPRFVANWRVGEGLAETVELPHGVSLVLADSMLLRLGADPAPLADALRRARGPWRILVVHHPLARVRDRGERGEALDAVYRGSVLAAIREAGVPVQLALSGEEHNLQALALEPPAPSLQIVAGGGGDVRPIDPGSPAHFALASLGFARVDLVADPGGELLVASLFATDPGLLGRGRTRLAARYAVDREGRVHAAFGDGAPAPDLRTALTATPLP
jgi:hypothetical protein